VKNNTVKAKREKGHKEKGQFFYLEKVLDLIRCVEAWVNGQNSLEHICKYIFTTYRKIQSDGGSSRGKL